MSVSKHHTTKVYGGMEVSFANSSPWH